MCPTAAAPGQGDVEQGPSSVTQRGQPHGQDICPLSCVKAGIPQSRRFPAVAPGWAVAEAAAPTALQGQTQRSQHHWQL